MGHSSAAIRDGTPPWQARFGAALWFTGLPGAGKSTVAGAVRGALVRLGLDVVWLRLDEADAACLGADTCDASGREEPYRRFAEEAADLAGRGRLVLMDASGPELALRRGARSRIERFAEVYLRCGVSTAMARKARSADGLAVAGLYAKAIKRKATGQRFEGLGKVTGVDVPFEEDPEAELVLDAGRLSAQAMAERVLDRFAAWWR